MQIAKALGEIPTNIASQLRAPTPDATVQGLTTEIVNAYLAIYYYTAIANVGLQGHLPALDSLQPDDRAKSLVDSSYNDFVVIERIISGLNPTLVQASVLHHLYAEASINWKPYVRDSTRAYQARQSGA
ncbi:hypothetical protein MYX04_11255 [Nitrospiraceae bacterium AH_259_D15_M11_P09]|nr:hypothetical protein [Nitrospiraceae bacterium AH_259_D15_M11_P09]